MVAGNIYHYNYIETVPNIYGSKTNLYLCYVSLHPKGLNCQNNQVAG